MGGSLDPFRLPAGLASAGDPIEGNPFSENDIRHAVWNNATRAAEEKICRLNADFLKSGPGDLTDYPFRLLDLILGKFDVWAERYLHIVWGDTALPAYDQWLFNYAQAWLEELKHRHSQLFLVESRARLIERMENWKAESRRYVAQQKAHIPSAANEDAAIIRVAADKPFQWSDIDHSLVTLKLAELSEDIRKEIDTDERRLRLKIQKGGNAAGYPSGLLELHKRWTDEWARRTFEVYCDVWRIQGHNPSAAFVRDVCARGVIPLIRARTGAVAFELELLAKRTNRPNMAAVLNAWRLTMSRAEGRWTRRLEAYAKECGHAARVKGTAKGSAPEFLLGGSERASGIPQAPETSWEVAKGHSYAREQQTQPALSKTVAEGDDGGVERRSGTARHVNKRKGDPTLLAGHERVTFRTAEQYLGITERQRQNLVKSGNLTVEGRGLNRRITTESLRNYLPPENPK